MTKSERVNHWLRKGNQMMKEMSQKRKKSTAKLRRLNHLTLENCIMRTLCPKSYCYKNNLGMRKLLTNHTFLIIVVAVVILE